MNDVWAMTEKSNNCAILESQLKTAPASAQTLKPGPSRIKCRKANTDLARDYRARKKLGFATTSATAIEAVI